jgi:hypothetical protein
MFFGAAYILLILHWMLFKNECILSYFEKRILDPEYTLGSRQFDNPLYTIVFGRFTYITEIVLTTAIAMAVLTVIYRSGLHSAKYIGKPAMLIVIGMLLVPVFNSNMTRLKVRRETQTHLITDV